MYKKKAKMKGKKAVSVIVSYVLLISLALGMSALVYSWLKYKIGGIVPKESCPDGVNLVLESYNCTTDGLQKYVNITVRNRGLFTVNGFIIKMSNISTGIAGLYPLCVKGITPCKNEIERNITPLGTGNDRYSEEFIYTMYNKIRQIEIEPKLKGAYCDKAITSQAVPLNKCP